MSKDKMISIRMRSMFLCSLFLTLVRYFNRLHITPLDPFENPNHLTFCVVFRCFVIFYVLFLTQSGYNVAVTIKTYQIWILNAYKHKIEFISSIHCHSVFFSFLFRQLSSVHFKCEASYISVKFGSIKNNYSALFFFLSLLKFWVVFPGRLHCSSSIFFSLLRFLTLN